MIMTGKDVLKSHVLSWRRKMYSSYLIMSVAPWQLKANTHYTSFPVASLQQVCNINDKSVTSLQQVGAGKSCLCLLCRFPNSITTTSLVISKLATSPSTGKLRGNVSNGYWTLPGLNTIRFISASATRWHA